MHLNYADKTSPLYPRSPLSKTLMSTLEDGRVKNFVSALKRITHISKSKKHPTEVSDTTLASTTSLGEETKTEKKAKWRILPFGTHRKGKESYPLDAIVMEPIDPAMIIPDKDEALSFRDSPSKSSSSDSFAISGRRAGIYVPANPTSHTKLHPLETRYECMISHLVKISFCLF
jgi:hypothetical protein